MGFFKRIGLKISIPAIYFCIGMLYLIILWAGAKYAFGTVGYYIPIPYLVFSIASIPGLLVLTLLNTDNLFFVIIISAIVYAGIGWLLDIVFFQKSK